MNELFSRTKERSYENKLEPEHATMGLTNKAFSKPPAKLNHLLVYIHFCPIIFVSTLTKLLFLTIGQANAILLRFA